MTPSTNDPAGQRVEITVELIGEAALTVQDLARAGRVSPEWVLARVQAGVLEPCASAAGADDVSDWRFASATLTRVRRIAGLERVFDADPQLAALAADLMEEVARLRGRLAE